MKITFVLPCRDLSGGIRVAAIYAERLSQRGHDVCAVFPPDSPPTWQQQIRSLLKGQGWLRHESQETSHFDQINIAQHVASSSPIGEADIPDGDIVIATWWETAEWVSQLSDAKGTKVYFIQHHEVFDNLPKDRVRATYALPMHKITIANWLIDVMQNEYGDRNVSLVANSVDTKQFFAPPRNKNSTPTVGLLYSPISWKGCDTSLQAFSLAAKEVPNLQLIAFGTDNPTAELPLPPGTDYTCKPEQNMLRDIYARCDVWLCSSRSEGFHLPPLEAMACRCPVVSTEVGGSMDVINPGINGYLVPVNEDAAALAKWLVHILTLSDQQWRSMSDAAYATVTGYTWDDATDLFEAALHTAVERKQRGDFSDLSSKVVSRD
jgi:glycosyltransferase involved in cell wall biosynthesis